VSKTPTVREAEPEDLDTVREVVAAAYGGERTAGFFDGLRESSSWLGVTYVAEDKGTIVAAACFTRAWLDAPTKLFEVLVLSPVAVLPDRQRAGVGSLLVRDSLQQIGDRDEPLVFLEGDPGFFSRVGFVQGHELDFEPPSPRVPEPAFQVATLPGYDQPTMTGRVVYPDVWWEYDAVGVRPET
jgi:putative acetyltransferase